MSSREWNSLADSEREIIVRHQVEYPVKVSRIAIDFGIPVKVASLPPRISGQLRPDQSESGYIIRINRHEVRPRQRFTIAHEISHYLLHREHIGEGISDTVFYRSMLSSKIEAEANRLAADIIMPSKLIRDAMRKRGLTTLSDSVSILAELFEVSEAAMSLRLGV